MSNGEEKPTGRPPQDRETERQQLEREWQEAIRRGLRKGKPPRDLWNPGKKKGRGAK